VNVHVAGEGQDLTVDVPDRPGGERRIDGRPVGADLRLIAPGLYSVVLDGRAHEVTVEPGDGDDLRVTVDGRSGRYLAEDERLRAARAGAGRRSATRDGGGYAVAAPMPGRVIAVPVAVGDTVERGQTVVVLEAMKMESALSTPRAGRVAEVLVGPGQAVQQRQVLVRIES
jgi:acetyl/propionyl-CoA carboxylase alpha subunit